MEEDTTTLESMGIRSWCGILGNVTALFLFLSPVFTFINIIKKKSTDKFSGIPYVMTLLNCLISAWYGLPFITKNNILVTTVNGTGAVIQLVFVFIFILCAPKKEKYKISGLFISALVFFSIIILVSVLVFHGNNRMLFCGFAAAVFCTLMYASPLSIVWTVIKTKSVEFMPFFISLFVFVTSVCWLVYGVLGCDPFVAVPNGLGCALGAAQLILYFIYHDSKGGKAAEKNVELGGESLIK